MISPVSSQGGCELAIVNYVVYMTPTVLNRQTYVLLNSCTRREDREGICSSKICLKGNLKIIDFSELDLTVISFQSRTITNGYKWWQFMKCIAISEQSETVNTTDLLFSTIFMVKLVIIKIYESLNWSYLHRHSVHLQSPVSMIQFWK